MGAKTNLRYHLILTTKYRRPALTGIETAVYASMRQAEAHSAFRILAQGIEDGNHIHLAIKTTPAYSIAALVNRIKASTTKTLWGDPATAEHLSHYYWGTRRKLWHGAYYCATTGEVSTTHVLEYVQHQNGPDDPTTAIHQRS